MPRQQLAANDLVLRHHRADDDLASLKARPL